MSLVWLPENEGHESLLMGPAVARNRAAAAALVELKQIDSRLDLIYAKPGCALVPQDDRWYIIRRSDSGIGGMWQVSGEDGRSYSDVTAKHIEALRSMDVSRGDVARRIHEGRERRAQERAKHKEGKRQEFRDGLLDRINHIHDARISVPRAIEGD